MGIPAASKDEKIVPWPANVSQAYTIENEEDARKHWKRCTVLADESHRKFSRNKFTLFAQKSSADVAASVDAEKNAEATSSPEDLLPKKDNPSA